MQIKYLIQKFLLKVWHGKRHGTRVHQELVQTSKIIYYKTRLNEFYCFCFRARKALCVPQLVFSFELQSVSAGLTQDITAPAKHCPVWIMRPSYHETIITIETSLFACFWSSLKCDKLLTHRASNDQSNSGNQYFLKSILSRLQSKTKKWQQFLLPLTYMQTADLKWANQLRN